MKIALLLLALLGSWTPSAHSEALPSEVLIRVLIDSGDKRFEIKSDHPTLVALTPSQEAPQRPHKLHAWVALKEKRLTLNGKALKVNSIRVEAQPEQTLWVGGRKFRGTVNFQLDRSGQLLVINELPIEQYLYGVLPREMRPWWPMPALKAQAIAARTYALYQRATNRAAWYDVKNSQVSQMYAGASAERLRTNLAVDGTRGQVLVYQEKLFPAYFHSVCGGKTAASEEFWDIKTPPLAGSVVCRYCRLSPHYTWKARVPLAALEERLAKNQRPVGTILEAAVISQTPSGRAGRLWIRGTSAEAVVAAKDLRVWIGGKKIKNTWFAVHIKEDQAVFEGRGWGHGVGLCQWGSFFAAFSRKTERQILELYYPGADIKQDQKTKGML